MSDAEKVAAFDNLAEALTNRWHNGKWSWWNPAPACGTETLRATQAEALADLVAWAEKVATRHRNQRRVAIAVTGQRND